MACSVYLIPLITTLVGWFTNVVAVKMLFYPKKPLPIIGLQGLVPRRHEDLAKRISKMIAGELLSNKDLLEKFGEINLEKELAPFLDEKIDLFLAEIPHLFPMAAYS